MDSATLAIMQALEFLCDGMTRLETKLDALCEAMAQNEGEDEGVHPTTLDGRSVSVTGIPRGHL